MDFDQERVKLLWQEKDFVSANEYLETFISALPNDPIGYIVRVQTRMQEVGVENDKIKPEDSRFMIQNLTKAKSLIDKKQVKEDFFALNQAAFIYVFLASVYLASGNTSSINRKVKSAAKWVTKREFPQTEDYYIEPELLAEANLKLVIACERLGEMTEVQGALVGAVSNFRRMGDKESMKKAIQAHKDIFGYEPISLENMEQELPKFFDQIVNKGKGVN